jgi:signal-transduction protein with cAMP-binding, CBS, and nucleotidyltransferase domain
MASNPQWCLSADEWQARFAAWLRAPEPEALLRSTIFFDFRLLYGGDDLVEAFHLVPRFGVQQQLATRDLGLAAYPNRFGDVLERLTSVRMRHLARRRA